MNSAELNWLPIRCHNLVNVNATHKKCIMGEFFKFLNRFDQGWRRRAGLRILLLALLFAIIWIRSLAFYDEFRFHTGSERTDAFISTDSSIGWESRTRLDPSLQTSLSFLEFFIGNPFVDISGSTDPQLSRWDWKWCWLGFGVGTADRGIRNDTRFEHDVVWIVPDWAIVAPLLLASLILLGAKPGQSTEKKGDAPIQAP